MHRKQKVCGSGLFFRSRQQVPVNFWLDQGKEILIFQIGAGFVIGKIATLPGAGGMYGAAAAESVVMEKNAGTIFPGFEGGTTGHESFANLTVTDIKMAGNTVYVRGHDIQAGRAGLVTAESRAEIAKDCIAAQTILLRAAHGRKS